MDTPSVEDLQLTLPGTTTPGEAMQKARETAQSVRRKTYMYREEDGFVIVDRYPKEQDLILFVAWPDGRQIKLREF